MPTSSSVPGDGVPGVDNPYRANGSADQGRSVAGTHDLWVGRLFRAGMSPETVWWLMGDDLAAKKLREAISELELAIIDLTDMLPAHQLDPDPDGWQVQPSR
jgi:hypothetical protein